MGRAAHRPDRRHRQRQEHGRRPARAHGAAIVDTDAIARRSPARRRRDRRARAQFGADVIDADGALDRDRMRTLAFADPPRAAPRGHPASADRRRDRAPGRAAAAPRQVFDVPLLVESGRWRARVDRVLVVDCSEATQVAACRARRLDRATRARRDRAAGAARPRAAAPTR
jgi:dephospho-CoA kinase